VNQIKDETYFASDIYVEKNSTIFIFIWNE